VSGPSRTRDLYGLLGAVGVSLLGTNMSFLALPWFVLTTTGSATATGLVSFAQMAPYVLVQALGGPLVDRLGLRRTSVATDAAAAVLLGAVPALSALHALALPALCGLVALAGAARGAGDTARTVLLPGTAERAAMPLERASGLYDGAGRLATVVGAPVAGVLVAATSPATAIAVDAASFFVSALLVARVVGRAAEAAPVTGPAAQPYWPSLRAGLRRLMDDRLLLGIAVMLVATNFVDQAGAGVLLPVWARTVAHSPAAFGLVAGVFAAGAVAGNALTTWLGPRLPRRLTYAVGFAMAGAPRYVVMALAATVGPVMAVMLAAGLGAGGINPILGAVEYERVPRAMQARVLGAMQALAWIGIPFGSLAGGVAVTAVGLRGALAGAGVVYGAVTLAPFALPLWRQMDRGHAVLAAGSGEGTALP